MKYTPYSLSLVTGNRALLGTVAWLNNETEAAFVLISTGTIIPVAADDTFTSRNNIVGAAVRDGSSVITGSSMSLAGLAPHANRFYNSLADAIRYASVGDAVPEDQKERLIDALAKFYGWGK